MTDCREYYVNPLTKARSRMLIHTICFTLGTLFSALAFLEPVQLPSTASASATPPPPPQPKIRVPAPLVLWILLGMHFLLFIGLLFFHFSTSCKIDIPFRVLAGVVLVIWFVFWLLTVLYVSAINKRSQSGNGVRIIATVLSSLFLFPNMVYYIATMATDRTDRRIHPSSEQPIQQPMYTGM